MAVQLAPFEVVPAKPHGRPRSQEVKRQALLHLKPPDPAGGASGSGGEDWVTVEPPEPQSPVWSERWPQQQWQVAFELLFCHMPAAAKSLRPHQDDLLFFVPAAGGEEGGGRRRPPLLVRRRARQLPAELGVGGAGAAGVDWRASVLLNLVLQTGYCLAVATCRWGCSWCGLVQGLGWLVSTAQPVHAAAEIKMASQQIKAG